MKCSCPEHSPFNWMNRTTPSIFATDTVFKAKGNDALSAGHIMTEVVRKKRKQDQSHGSIYGLSKDRKAAIVKSKQFHVYSRAGTK